MLLDLARPLEICVAGLNWEAVATEIGDNLTAGVVVDAFIENAKTARDGYLQCKLMNILM